MFTYKISFEHHFKNSWPILIYLIGSFILPFYMKNRFGSGDTWIFVQLSAALFLLFFVPLLILHINYYSRNKGDIFFYDPIGQRITINRKGESVSFSFSDIELIKRFKSYPLAENRMQWFPWDSYNYSVIRLKGGQEFIVTSLLVPNMDLPIESRKIKLKKTFYPITHA
ncbi:hypothetical protein U3A58_04255 [Algoriphagus sp. C2-6-M1]|uniref:hypothetical protein n=1 Tax=Algoriphagus persicinus TaxID=3108754 RepID=UPI002B383D57|nr:hypothetical protein [Algoriphagus sp. C2-6-M1]MEB2779595.1 hypothetical protein [Algoriphagus sp. C2-6-M1]